jgi:hypothetical protein
VAGAAVPIIQQHLVTAQGLNVMPIAPPAPPPTVQPEAAAGERG